MSNLKGLGQPYEFWEYFEKISKIPRCSEHEEKVRKFIIEESEKLGFKSKVDSVGNLVINIPPKSKEKIKCVLQCHLDMVCEKNESITHNFSKDPLQLKIEEIASEKWLTAEGTTMGADNGVGICYLLTLMNKIHRRELEYDFIGFNLLFTIDEEQGLRGAFNIDKDFLDGNYLINLDSEEDDSVTIGCAGGLVHFIEIKIDRIDLSKAKNNFIPIKIFISGLLGGHSGVDIHLGRGNALKIIVQVLWELNKKHLFHICSIDGGNRTNAIPREINAVLYIEENKSAEILSFINNIFNQIKVIFDGIEPNLVLTIKRLENYDLDKVISPKIQEKVLDILYLMPNGPISMHPQIEGLVFTSSNLATVNTRGADIEIKLSQRSLSEYFKNVIWEKTKTLLEMSGLKINIKRDSDYPGWTPNFQSKLLAKCKETYYELYNESINIKAIHAGLECGILKKKFPQMEMISIGPSVEGAHSPDER
ncbi:MAG: beta-Ala-His dipeptidase [Promethearchaeota archaeon]